MTAKARVIPKAVYIGLGVFAVLHLSFVAAVNLSGNEGYWQLKLLGQVLVLAVSGFVAGAVAGVNGWLNGVMVGLVAPVVFAAGLALLSGQADLAGGALLILVPYWLLQAIVFCGLGGLLSDFLRI